MSTFYEIAYAVGFTPWEKAAAADGAGIEALFARVEADRGGPGRALDLGCGSGAHAVTLARRGWQVTGVDLVERALRRARSRAETAGVSVRFAAADVTRLPEEVVGSGIDFFLDLGCFHGLTPDQQRSMARAVSARAADDADLLMFAFAEKVGPAFMPAGADQGQIQAAFDGWVVLEAMSPSTDLPGLPRLARRGHPTFYRLHRQGQP